VLSIKASISLPKKLLLLRKLSLKLSQKVYLAQLSEKSQSLEKLNTKTWYNLKM